MADCQQHLGFSRHERKAFRHGSDSALTAEMFRGSSGGLSVLKLILFQSKSSSNTQRHYSLVDSKFKNAIPETESLTQPPVQYSIYYMNHGKVVYIANHTTLDLGHRKFAVRYTYISTANFL